MLVRFAEQDFIRKNHYTTYIVQLLQLSPFSELTCDLRCVAPQTADPLKTVQQVLEFPNISSAIAQ